MKLRISPPTVLVLGEFLQALTDWKCGNDISRATRSEVRYSVPTLNAFGRPRTVETRWQTTEAGKPPGAGTD